MRHGKTALAVGLANRALEDGHGIYHVVDTDTADRTQRYRAESRYRDTGDTLHFLRLWYRFGKHLRFEASYNWERFDVGGDRFYEAGVTQVNTSWQFSPKTFIRLILQKVDYDFEPANSTEPVDDRSQDLFSQFLFPYKLNPRTVVFVGYSDRSEALNDASLDMVGRSYFPKVGYAFALGLPGTAELVPRTIGLPSRSALAALPLRLAALRWRGTCVILGRFRPPPGVSTAFLGAVTHFSVTPFPGESHTVVFPSNLERWRHNTVYCTPAGTGFLVLSAARDSRAQKSTRRGESTSWGARGPRDAEAVIPPVAFRLFRRSLLLQR